MGQSTKKAEPSGSGPSHKPHQFQPDLSTGISEDISNLKPNNLEIARLQSTHVLNFKLILPDFGMLEIIYIPTKNMISLFLHSHQHLFSGLFLSAVGCYALIFDQNVLPLSFFSFAHRLLCFLSGSITRQLLNHSLYLTCLCISYCLTIVGLLYLFTY